MSGYHFTTAIGNVGQEPDMRYTPGGDAVLNFSVAVNEKWRNRDGGTGEHTEWYDVTIFGKRAEALQQYIHRGDRIHVAGQLRTRQWQDQQSGQTRYKTTLRAQEVTLLSDNRRQTAAPGAASGQIPGGTAATTPQADDFDDDIPF